VVMYADDGVVFGDMHSLTEDQQWLMFGWPSYGGTVIEETKSHWVKKDGKWLRPLKFLGLEYDGKKDEFRANTRKGSKLIYDKDELLELVNERELIS
jgi:hypothetical protein